MKRVVGLAIVLVLASSVWAQKPQDESPSMMDRAVSASIAVAKNLWDKVQKEGRPLAEKLLKAAPEYYKGSQKALKDFIKRVDQAEIPKNFSEKQKMALELWRLRGAINVMALSDPEMVKMLLKMQPADVQKMQKDLQNAETKLKKANLPGI